MIDEGIKQEHTKEMTGLVSGVQRVVRPDVSHFAMWQDPAAFDTAVLDLLTAE